jgi:2-dehydro-3-deoxyglucarate aldolase/4-hydroxy-2-oxoheptanedioate aldolase
MRDNPLKQKLANGEPVFGTMAWEFFTPSLPQICSAAGAEFVLLDMEHSGVGMDTIKNQIALCRGLPIQPFVRVPTTAYQYVARVLDAGATGVMVPMVETAEQARTIVSWCRYPPLGRRGAAFGAAHDDFLAGPVTDKIAQAHARTFVICQIETEVGLRNVDRIAQVDGVDCVWVGHFDLTNFLGIPAQFDHPAYVKGIARVVAAAEKHGKVAGFMAIDRTWALDYLAKGFRVIAYGLDTALMQAGIRTGIEALREAAAARTPSKPQRPRSSGRSR